MLDPSPMGAYLYTLVFAFVMFTLGWVIGSAYPAAWVERHPYVKVIRGYIDLYWHRREARRVWTFCQALVDWATSARVESLAPLVGYAAEVGKIVGPTAAVITYQVVARHLAVEV